MQALDEMVEREVYQVVAESASDEFAFSYLVKARQVGKRITPHPFVAWRRLTQNKHAMEALQKCRIMLIKPEPWRAGRDRPEIHSQAA